MLNEYSIFYEQGALLGSLVTCILLGMKRLHGGPKYVAPGHA